VTRDSGPEEFFEVFREVQESKKRDQQGDDAPVEHPKTAAPKPSAAPAVLRVSYPVAAAVVVGVVLLVAAAYLLGKQQGWQAHAAARKRAASRPRPGPSTQGAPAAPAAPELVDGKVFTLVTYGRARPLGQRARAEADFLNGSRPFQALGVQAYAYRDRTSTWRLCARGLAAMTPAARETVKARIRKLTSSAGTLDFKDADFFAP